jgi:hypothetical protein
VLDLNAPCDQPGHDIECVDEPLVLPAAGGAVAARFDCQDYVGE